MSQELVKLKSSDFRLTPFPEISCSIEEKFTLGAQTIFASAFHAQFAKSQEVSNVQVFQVFEHKLHLSKLSSGKILIATIVLRLQRKRVRFSVTALFHIQFLEHKTVWKLLNRDVH